MCRLLDYIEAKADQGAFDICANVVHSFMRNVGNALVIVVYGLMLFLSFTSFTIILPYEQLYKPTWLLHLLYIFGSYLLINVAFHYHKARTIAPSRNTGKEGDRWCHKCSNWKSDDVHHCSLCEKCIIGMDHHCIWINQCVGSHNHRHFFLFIAFLSCALITIVGCGFNTAYDHILVNYAHHSYCSTALDFALVQDILCDYGELPRNFVIFCYCISLLLLLLVGGLTLWNVYLISKGLTFIDYLKREDLRPHSRGFRTNWINFLNLRRNRTFWRHVLLPSAHTAVYEKDTPLLESDIV